MSHDIELVHEIQFSTALLIAYNGRAKSVPLLIHAVVMWSQHSRLRLWTTMIDDWRTAARYGMPFGVGLAIFAGIIDPRSNPMGTFC